MSKEEGAPGTEEREGGGSGSQHKEHKAFIGGLSFQMNDEDLRRAFERFDANGAEVMIDRHTGRSRGFGFVYFKDEQGLKDAIAEMHDKELEGRRISVVKAVPQDQTRPGTPAAALGAGAGARRDYAARRDGPPPRRDYGGYYDRGYPPERPSAYDRYGGDRYGYDPRAYAAYDSRYYGYDRPGATADPWSRAGGYGSYGYGGGGAYAGYDDRGYGSGYYDRYDDRGAGGPDRRGYSSASARAAPYDRPADRRPSEPPRR